MSPWAAATPHVLAALIQIRDDGPFERSMGICWNVELYLDKIDYAGSSGVVDSILEALFEQWPGRSGQDGYPVPGPGGSNAVAAFMTHRDCWIGEYGDSRRELLNFCIEELQRG